VRITFKKDKVEKETHAISYPIYSRILLKIKSVAHLSTEETNEVQE
jgi:type II secretory ATPase GspE/PulE/Tfp pilus assembly ATPase PilB-like protein